MLRLGITADVDLAPLFFPIEAAWVELPNSVKFEIKSLPELETALLAGSLDCAMLNPATYALNHTKLHVLPLPVRATDLASDSLFIISLRRLDLMEKVRVAVAPNALLGEMLLQTLAGRYYGITAETFAAPSDAQALEMLGREAQVTIIGGEAGMRAVGWAKAKGYEVQDVTRAWWILTGQPLPTYLMCLRKEWVENDPEAALLVRSLLMAFRRALQSGKEQRPTLLEQCSKRTGLPEEALENHFRAQRYEYNEAHLRGLFEFFRRVAANGTIPLVKDLNFYPAIAGMAPPPPEPIRKIAPQPSRNPNTGNASRDEAGGSSRSKTNSRQEAEQRGLRVIKGGKDGNTISERENSNDSDSSNPTTPREPRRLRPTPIKPEPEPDDDNEGDM